MKICQPLAAPPIFAGKGLDLSRVRIQGRFITDKPGVAERIAESSLSVDAPRSR